MCRFIESLKVQKGEIWNWEYHSLRLNKTRKEVFNCTTELNLLQEIILPKNLEESVYKCRVIYSKDIEHIEFIPYQKRNIKSLKLIAHNSIHYSYKYENRSTINQLYQQKEKCDDILIIKNKMVTDTSYCNIAFSDGGIWYTPSLPLLKGTMRQKLLNDNIITEKLIGVIEIKYFDKARIFNAIIGWDASNNIAIKNIIFD